MSDFTLETTFDIKFTTRAFATGAPFTLAGTPAVSAYPDNSTTQLTAGVTLTVDFDSVTGLNNVRVVATAANGYATATSYALVITTGTVNGVSVVGSVVGEFTLGRPSTANVTQIAAAAVSTATAHLGVNVVQLSADATAADNAEAFFDGTGYAGTGNVIPSVTTVTGNVNGSVGSVTGAVGSVGADGITASSIAANAIGASELAADAATEIADAVIARTLGTESYAADGAVPTLAQAMFLIMQTIGEFAIASTTITVKRLDGSTTAATYTLNDATTPTSRTRAT